MRYLLILIIWVIFLANSQAQSSLFSKVGNYFTNNKNDETRFDAVLGVGIGLSNTQLLGRGFQYQFIIDDNQTSPYTISGMWENSAQNTHPSIQFAGIFEIITARNLYFPGLWVQVDFDPGNNHYFGTEWGYYKEPKMPRVNIWRTRTGLGYQFNINQNHAIRTTLLISFESVDLTFQEIPENSILINDGFQEVIPAKVGMTYTEKSWAFLPEISYAYMPWKFGYMSLHVSGRPFAKFNQRATIIYDQFEDEYYSYYELLDRFNNIKPANIGLKDLQGNQTSFQELMSGISAHVRFSIYLFRGMNFADLHY